MSDNQTMQVRLRFDKGGDAYVDDVTPEATRLTMHLKSGRTMVFRPTGQVDADGRVVFLQVPGSTEAQE